MSVQETRGQTDRVLTSRISSACSGSSVGIPVFLWLVLVPEADGWAVVVLFLSGL